MHGHYPEESFYKMIGAIEQKAVFRCHFLSEGATEGVPVLWAALRPHKFVC